MDAHKPVKTSFITQYVAAAFVLAVVVAAAITYFASMRAGAVAGVILVVAAAMRRTKQYSRESYELREDGIHVTRGTRFNHEEIHVPWSRVTTVNHVKPFFQRLIFNTGQCMIDSAGSHQSSIMLRHIEDDLPQRIQGRLTHSQDATHEARPSKPAAVVKSLWQAVTSIIGLIAVFFIPGQTTINPFVITVIAVSLAASGLAAIRRIADDISLAYTTYDDHVSIAGGIFRQRRHVLLADHITDTATNQSFLDRILNVEELTVSVAGGERSVPLPYLNRDSGFEQHIPQGHSPPAAEDTREKREQPGDDPHSSGDSITAKPSTARSLIGIIALLLILSPVFIAAPITLIFIAAYAGQQLIFPFVTTYEQTRGEVTRRFTFFQRRETTFQTDRVTAVVVKKNPLDEAFNTATVAVQTVGSSTWLTLKHLDTGTELYDKIRALRTLTDTEHEVLPRATPQTTLLRFLPRVLAGLAVIGGVAGRGHLGLAAGLLAVGAITMAWATWRLSHASLRFGPKALTLSTGVLFKRRVTARYADIKRVQSTLYPAGNVGSITVSVPGGSQSILFSTYSLHGAVNPWEQHGVVDGCVQAQAWASPMNPGEPRWSDTPWLPGIILRGGAAAAALIVAAAALHAFNVISVYPVVGAALVGAAGLIAHTVYYYHVRYTMSDRRYIAEHGILYRSATTLLHDRIDYDDINRSWYHLLTGSGTVSLYTTGSDEKDLVIDTVRSYREVATHQ